MKMTDICCKLDDKKSGPHRITENLTKYNIWLKRGYFNNNIKMR